MLFYDTNALLNLGVKVFTDKFMLSSVSLQELEDIKTSNRKDENTKFLCRSILRLLNDHSSDGSYEVIIPTQDVYMMLNEYGLQPTPDNIICASARIIADTGEDDLEFVTQDLACKVIAKFIFGLKIQDNNQSENNYTGFKEVVMSDEDMAYFYEHLNENKYGLITNEYLIIKNINEEVVDTYRWTGIIFEPLYKKNVKSVYFEKLKPKDIYQNCAIDAMMNCTLTAISGKAGTGKSLLALIVAMSLIESGKYERLVILFNPTKARGANDLGYYSGDFIDKAMQNSIGQILTTKFGDRYAVDILLGQNKLKLVSMADCRGFEVTDNEILWITEAQNTSVELIKLCLSRVSSGAKIFIEGDYDSQVDSHVFEGNNNGLKRVIEAFKGQEEFGYIHLQNVWRSKIAELCELLTNN